MVSVRRTIPAGVLDSGVASLATFVIGVQAVRMLDPVALGAYALVFSGFSLLMEVSARLVFLPAEIHAARQQRSHRLAILPHSLRLGAAPVVLAGLLLAGVFVFLPGEVESGTAVALIATAVPCTMVSPVQDHLRKILHIGGRSYTAAAVSGAQFVVVAGTLAALALWEVPAAWHPFGALLAANIGSTIVGLVAWWRMAAGPLPEPPSLAVLAGSGRWHLLGAVMPKGGIFAAASLVAHLAGAPALGYAEGARILARPIGVLSQGIKTTLGPPLMRAGARFDRTASRRLSRTYAAVMAACGGAYLLVAGFDWAINPLADLMPGAYAVEGLAAVTIALFTLDRVAGAGAGLQLFGAGRERTFAMVEVVSSLGFIAGGFTAPFTGAFAVPLGYLLASVIRRPWLALHVRRIYRDGPQDENLAAPERPTDEPLGGGHARSGSATP